MFNRKFRNFTLAEISHLHPFEIYKLGFDQAAKIVQERLEEGKRIIDTQTQPGDLILIETPYPMTEKEFLHNYKEPSGLTDQELRDMWNAFDKEHMNFYFTLANYAKKKGRIVESIESGMYSPDSNWMRLVMNSPQNKEVQERLEYLGGARRNISMQKRIESKKPKLVIVASAHALVLSDRMLPKRTFYTNRALKSRFARFFSTGQALYEDRSERMKEKERKRKKVGLHLTKI